MTFKISDSLPMLSEQQKPEEQRGQYMQLNQREKNYRSREFAVRDTAGQSVVHLSRNHTATCKMRAFLRANLLSSLCSCMCVSMWVVLTVNILRFRIWFCGTWNRLQGDGRRRSSQETAAFPGASYTHRLKSAELTEPHRNRASPQLSLYRLQDGAGRANQISERWKLQQWMHSNFIRILYLPPADSVEFAAFALIPEN